MEDLKTVLLESKIHQDFLNSLLDVTWIMFNTIDIIYRCVIINGYGGSNRKLTITSLSHHHKEGTSNNSLIGLFCHMLLSFCTVLMMKWSMRTLMNKLDYTLSNSFRFSLCGLQNSMDLADNSNDTVGYRLTEIKFVTQWSRNCISTICTAVILKFQNQISFSNHLI